MLSNDTLEVLEGFASRPPGNDEQHHCNSVAAVRGELGRRKPLIMRLQAVVGARRPRRSQRRP